ncbi:MAG TPA: PAS domain S-box protein, partial [Pseudomonadales bacterium]|nr:PAS domain S-box protein [Pseudomonadales bacterium]
LEVLHALHILDTEPEARFDRITRLAQRLFNIPVALISLMDENRQWFKSKQGVNFSQTSRDQAFSAYTILQDDIFCVADLAADVRFVDNPQVSGEPHFRFYAGAPLKLSSGVRIGTLCLLDTVPRQFSEQDKLALRDLADGAEAELARAELAALTEQIQFSKIRYRTVLDTVLDAVLTIDSRGVIQTTNAAVTRMFGYGAEELTGQNVKMLMPEPYRSEHDGYLDRYHATGVTHILGVQRQLIGRHKSGQCFPIELAVSRMDIGNEIYFTGTIRDITQEKLAASKLHAVNSQRQAILEAANFTIISTDVDGVIRSFNRGAQRMLGYSEGEVVGKVTPAIIHDLEEVEARAKALSKELNRQIEPGFEVFVAKAKLGFIDENEWTYIRKDGSRFPVLLSITALRDEEGNINGFVGIGSDITERKKMDQMKAEFISTVSHELRTPLTSIRGALSLVLGKAADGLSEKARKLLETANRNSERLTLLINDILDLEKIESGRLDFNFSVTDLVLIAHQAIQANEGYAARHAVRLVLRDCP